MIVVSLVNGLGLITMISSVVVMSGVAEEKCSNCCELSIGLKATSGRCCEWNHCCEWSSCCEWSNGREV